MSPDELDNTDDLKRGYEALLSRSEISKSNSGQFDLNIFEFCAPLNPCLPVTQPTFFWVGASKEAVSR
jgi:hypothetical protein